MIKGKKTFISAVEEEHLEKLLYWRNLEDFRVNFREFRELNLKQQTKWFEKVNSSKNEFMFSIFNLHDNSLIGACGLLYIDWIIRSADFSFYIGMDEKYIDDDGLAYDSAKILMDYGFNTLNLNKIWMELYSFDEKKLDFFKNQFNFKVDAQLRDNVYAKGKYHDSFILSLLKKDFK